MLVNGRVGGGVLHGAAVVVRDVGAGPAHDPLLGQSLAVKKGKKYSLLYVSNTNLGGGKSGDSAEWRQAVVVRLFGFETKDI